MNMNERKGNGRSYLDLPDDVLLLILSRLTIKEVVRTTVLSREWMLKWNSMSKVNVDTADFSSELREEGFVDIVAILVHRLQSITNLRLRVSTPIETELGRISTLVSDILGPNLKSLELSLCNREHFFFPTRILTCTSLTTLELLFTEPSSFRVPAGSHFPYLKHLSLTSVKILADNHNLIISLPSLVVLELTECKWVKANVVEIDAPLLEKLACTTPSEWDDKKDLEYTIVIHGTKLNGVYLDGGYQENFIIKNGSNVFRASLDLAFDHPLLSLGECGLQVRKLLRKLPNLVYLNISNLQAIGETKEQLSLPKFTHLHTLHLSLGTISYARGLFELLHASPALKFLTMALEILEDFDYNVQPVPQCVHHLEEFTIFYECEEPDFRIEEFLLKKGAQLKNVYVTSTEVVEQLSMFPRASPFLQIIPLRISEVAEHDFSRDTENCTRSDRIM